MLAYNHHVYGKRLETSIIKRDDDVVVEYYWDLNRGSMRKPGKKPITGWRKIFDF
jgi:hypothetical protein